MRRFATALVITSLFTISACDGGGDAPAADAPPAKTAEQQERERIAAEAKKKREEEAKAAEEAEKKKQEAIAALIVLPEEVPKKKDKACEMLVDAQDKFMMKYFPEKWPEGKATQLAMTKKMCTDQPPEISACQANALLNAPEELNREVPEFFRLCQEKFTPAEGAG